MKERIFRTYLGYLSKIQMSKYIIVLTLIYVILAVVAIYVLSKFYSISDISGIGQLVIDILLLPTVIIGFYITIVEFRKAQEKPQIELQWFGDIATTKEGENFILEYSTSNTKEYFLYIHAINTGRVMTSWFRIEVKVPFSLVPFDQDESSYTWFIGDQSNWTKLIKTNSNNNYACYIIKINGTTSIYPKEQLPVGKLTIKTFPGIMFNNQHKIHYSISTERTDNYEKILSIYLHPEDLNKKFSADSFLQFLLMIDLPD
jgi:hypothetical protein